MHRFFVDEQGILNGSACLEASDAYHAARVLRLKKGDEVVLMDGQRLYRASIATLDGSVVQCDILEGLPSPEASLCITLYQGLPKADKLEWIVQKCTEAGIMAIVPVAMSRCVSVVDGKDAPKKQERWQRIAREAAKQSGRAVVPQVHLPMTLSKALEQCKKHDLVLVPWEEAEGSGPRVVHEKYPQAKDIAIVIGPEGGIAPEEIETLRAKAGAVPITLGKRILRTETAGLAASIALLALWGDMG